MNENNDEKPSISAMSSRRPSYAAEFSSRKVGQAEYGSFAQTFGLWDRQEHLESYLGPLKQLRSQSFSEGPISQEISRYFEQPSVRRLLYIVEFKACRTDVFYLPEGVAEVHVGDLVIVEADRGQDLGKVMHEALTPTQVRTLRPDDVGSQPKVIHRLALPDEVTRLLKKAQLETEALQLCQERVKARELPMEVVDSEYQWDMKKLTFYYFASQRIDFRELVKDLFKVYKTRIWMCAVNPAAIPGNDDW